MEVKCSSCGTLVSKDAVMCYACGTQLDRNPYHLSEELLFELNKADDAMDNEKWQEAILHYNKILEQRPEISHYWICAGLAFGFQNNKQEQWNYLNKAIQAGPNNPEPWQARFEFVCEDARDKFQLHIDEYFHQFGLGEEPLLHMGEMIIMLSPQDIKLAIEYLNSVYNANPKNKRAKKLLKVALKIQKKAK